ncbi:MAG: hypothetical protein Kilf2KO_05460 [Rhodospirillales bacterium]
MSKPFTVIAHLVAAEGHVDETKAFLLDLIDKTRAEEGCTDYHLHQDNENPAEFTFYETWVDRAAWDRHMEMPYLAEFIARKDELFAVEPHIRLMTMVSEKG